MFTHLKMEKREKVKLKLRMKNTAFVIRIAENVMFVK